MIVGEYRNFDLLLTRDGDRFRAVVVDAPEGEGSVVFDTPALHGPSELAGTGTRLGVSPSEPAPLATLSEYGKALFTAVFRDQVAAVLTKSRATAEHDGAGLRIRLRFDPAAAGLAAAPWETLYDPIAGTFLAADERSPIIRYLPLARSRSALLVEPPLRIMAVLASPSDLPAIDIDAQLQRLENVFAPLRATRKVTLEALRNPTLQILRDRLGSPLGEPVHVLYFMGHGVFDEAQAAGYLALVDETTGTQLVNGDDFAAVLSTHPSLRLAYLDACQGALSSDQSVFAGVAQAILRNGVPACIAMQAEISEASAAALAERFFTAIAGGSPVDAALSRGRAALKALGTDEWAIPVLFSRSPDNRLFDLRDVLPKPECPYPGMAPFTQEQAELFFGRDKEIKDALARLRENAFLAVVGPSGSGKSSLIYAGLIPALPSTSGFGAGDWRVLVMRPSDSRTHEGKAAPLQALATVLGCPPDQVAASRFDAKTFLLIDQFEEVFTQAAPQEATAFLDALGAPDRRGLIGRSNLYVLLTARADFYPDLMACSLWPVIRSNRLELTPLGDDELWAAIVEPAAHVGVVVEDALAVQLISDASGQVGVLPLVQETLVLLWDRLERRQLRLNAYRQMADGGRTGLEVAIDRRASRVYEGLSPAAQRIARRIFLRLVQFGEGRADTRRQQTVDELRAHDDEAGLFDETLAALVQARLLTSSGKADDQRRRIDIAHEALIRGWSQLQGWLKERRAAEQTRRRLEEKAVEWARSEHRGGLLDAFEAQEAETWLSGSDAQEVGYSSALTELLGASKTRLAREAAAQVEAERNRRRLRLFAAGLGLAALVIAAVTYLAISATNARREAQVSARLASDNAAMAGYQRTLADAARATAEAAAQVADNKAQEAAAANAETQRLARGIRADQLAVNALKALPDNSLALTLAIESLRIQSDQREPVTGSALSNARRTMVTAGVALSSTIEAKADIVGGLDLSPGGARLATVGGNGEIIVSSANISRTESVVLRPGEGTIQSLVFGPEQTSQLVSVDADGRTLLWDWRRPNSGPRLLEGAAYPVAFHGRGAKLATASNSGDVLIWNLVAAGEAPHRLPGAGRPAGSSSDAGSDWLITLDGNHAAWLWKDERQEPLPCAASGVDFPAASSADGHWFAAVADHFSVRLWDMHSVSTATLASPDDTGATIGLTISPDSKWLLAVRGNQRAQLWRLDRPAEAPVSWSGILLPVAFSPDGNWLAAASGTASVRLFSLANPLAPPVELDGVEALTLGFSADSASVITVNRNGAVAFHLWQAHDLIALGCREDGVNLSPRQWADFVPGMPQRPTCPGWATPPDPPLIFQGKSLAAHRGWFVKLARVTDPIWTLGDASRYQITVQPAKAAPGQEYWRAIGVYHLIADDNLGSHHVFVDALDEAGLRDRNPELQIAWGWEGQAPGEPSVPVTLDRPDDEMAAGRLPLWKGQHAWIEVTGDGAPSDRVVNIHTGWPDEGGGTTLFHHSFYVVFQRTRIPEVSR